MTVSFRAKRTVADATITSQAAAEVNLDLNLASLTFSPIDEAQRRKRGRPPKSRVSQSPISGTPALVPAMVPAPVQTPQMSAQVMTHMSPPQASPTKVTPSKGTVLKALPTVRDHTTDQLNEAGDEYIPREFDDAGEKKVAPNGAPLGGRVYRCKTFFVPKRGDKLFMLATECARVLGYRDSYLLFNKNRSLHKIIANQEEKDDLIAQEILPYSYRSRQIAIVTARSMYRQFGSRLVENGRRVRDDYWESKARKQGFTEEDAAGEKRPGAAKQREAAAAAEANNAAMLAAMPQGQIIYANGPGDPLSAGALEPLPMMNLPPTDDMRPRDYSSVQRPRHELSGQPYQDRTQASSAADLLSHASSTAEFNKTLGQQRVNRSTYMNDLWRRPHEAPAAPVQRVPENDATAASQAYHSPQLSTTGPGAAAQQSILQQQAGQQQPSASLMGSAAYSAQPHQQSMIPQSPSRQMAPMPPMAQLQQRSPSVSGGSQSQSQQPPFGSYSQNQMWPPQPSPMQQPAHPAYGQYPGQQMAPSPHMQSPMQPPPPQHAQQIHHSPGPGTMPGQGQPHPQQSMGYPGMLPAMTTQYANMPRGMYNAPTPSPQHFMQSGPNSQPGMPGWAPAGSQQQQPGQWQGY